MGVFVLPVARGISKRGLKVEIQLYGAVNKIPVGISKRGLKVEKLPARRVDNNPPESQKED